MKQQDELKRLYWSTDKDRIKHILSRVNIKYLYGLLNKLKDIQHHKIYDPIEDDIDYYDKVDFQEVNKINYVTSKVVCKYDGCIFEVSLKTIKDELKRRSEEAQK
jgi:hypothetical protein